MLYVAHFQTIDTSLKLTCRVYVPCLHCALCTFCNRVPLLLFPVIYQAESKYGTTGYTKTNLKP